MSRFGVVSGIAFVALAGFVSPVAAQDCGCASRSGHAVENLPHYRAAFAGRVESLEPQEGSVKVTFQVVRSWKGPRGKTLSVTTPAGACGFGFEPGKGYLVYTAGSKDALTTNVCAPNTDIAAAGNAVRQLDLHAGYGSTPLRMQGK